MKLSKDALSTKVRIALKFIYFFDAQNRIFGYHSINGSFILKSTEFEEAADKNC